VPLLGLLLASACVSEQREQEMGDMMAVDINAQLPLVQDPILNGYVTSLGSLLAKVSERPGLSYRFYVINSPTVNAFALPGGHIYLTRGLIEQTRSGGELAAALAHEIGHVAERHGVDKMERQLRTGSLVGILYNLILGGEPDLLRRKALQLGGALWSARHSREAEQHADEKAVEYLLRAGIDPGAMVSLLRKLVAVESQDSSQVAAWFSSHPLTRQRIAEAELEIAEVRQEIDAVEDEPVALLPEYLQRYPLFLERLASIPGPSLLR
jgi:beta-barrel assembly-enhancing protease